MISNKRVAILMLCHTLPDQINDFIKILDCSSFDFFIHVDKKSNTKYLIQNNDKICFIPDEQRINVQWGKYSMVQASIELIKAAMKKNTYDYYWLCSGQDFPIKSSDEILRFFNDKKCNFMSFSSSRNYPVNGYENTRFDKRYEIFYPSWIIGKSLIKRVIRRIYCVLTGGTGHTFELFKRDVPSDLKIYFGSQWWCLNIMTVEWIIDYINKHQEICDFYKNVFCPDESFFHTLVMGSPYANDIKENLVYIDWSAGRNSPKILDESDYFKIINSDKLLARKIDSAKEPRLYGMLKYNCLQYR